MSTPTTRTTKATSRPTAKHNSPPAAKSSSATKEPSNKVAPKSQPEPTTLVEALATGQAVLVKVRANKTVRSLPYLAPGTDQRKQAEALAAQAEKGETIPALAADINVSTATARRFLTHLALAREVEAGTHDKAWVKGEKQVVVHTVKART